MAKDTTFEYTDINQAPWYVVPSDDKRGDKVTLCTIWGEESCVVEEFGTIDGWPGVTVKTKSGDRITVLRSSITLGE